MNKPDSVKRAVLLLYCSIGISVVSFVRIIVQFSQRASDIPSSILLIAFLVPVISIALLWFLTYKIGQGRNWARITLIVLLILGTLSGVVGLLALGGQPSGMLPSSFFTKLIEGVQWVLQVLVLIFLLQKSSADWFRQMSGGDVTTTTGSDAK